MKGNAGKKGPHGQGRQASLQTAGPHNQLFVVRIELPREAQLGETAYAKQQVQKESGQACLGAELRIGIVGHFPHARHDWKGSRADTNQGMLRCDFKTTNQQLAPLLR